MMLSRLLSTCAAFAAVSAAVLATLPAAAGVQFQRVETQFIAALGDPTATSGTGAEQWGMWGIDPGPRGVQLDDYPDLKAASGRAPDNWQFDDADWWLDEHGIIMEKPDFPIQAGKYLVTGGREVSTILTVHPKDKDGHQRWELAKDATLYDVTHLPCRSARYTPGNGAASCTPAAAEKTAFPVKAGAPMPPVTGCNKQDYAVLFVVAVEADE